MLLAFGRLLKRTTQNISTWAWSGFNHIRGLLFGNSKSSSAHNFRNAGFDQPLLASEYSNIVRQMPLPYQWRDWKELTKISMLWILPIHGVLAWHYLFYVRLCTLECSLPWQLRGLKTFAISVFHGLFINLVLSFWQCIGTDPGRIPKYWGFRAGEETLRRRFCKMCGVWKPDRCHHCSICNRCHLNMDHHSPWINNCIGFYNRKFFVQFLLYSYSTLLFVALTTPPITLCVWFGGGSKLACLLCTFMLTPCSLLLISTLTNFLKFHLKLALENYTTIENLDREEGDVSKFTVGARGNWEQILGASPWLWLCPLYLQRSRPVGDGVRWPFLRSSLLALDRVSGEVTGIPDREKPDVCLSVSLQSEESGLKVTCYTLDGIQKFQAEFGLHATILDLERKMRDEIELRSMVFFSESQQVEQHALLETFLHCSQLSLKVACGSGPASFTDEALSQMRKILIVGDATTGKSHIINRLLYGSLPQDPAATIGCEFHAMVDGLCAQTQIWEKGGDQRYFVIGPPSDLEFDGAVIVYDVTQRASFHSCRDKWLDVVQKYSKPNVSVMLVGNKVDLVEKDPMCRQVYQDDAMEFAGSHEMLFCEASAVTAYNVPEIFESLQPETKSTSQIYAIAQI